LFWPRLSTASLKSSLKLESLRTAAENSALMPMNPSSQVSSQVLNEKNCRLGFGFASLVDIRARLVDFVSSFQPPAEARHHETINSRQEMLETLAFCFVAGRAAEFRIPKELFEEVMRKMEGVQHWKTLGGNGASMSKRASHEGCLAYLASPITSEMKGYFDQKRTVFLNENLESPDFHVILEYREGETWGRYVASRSNRFYVNHDNHNINPKVFQTINLPEPLPVFALGGFQLLEGSPKEDEFLSSALSKINSLKSSKVKIHFEMGDFHSISFFSKLQALIKESDSIGFNEQELGILLCHLKKIKFGGYPSKAPVKKYLSDLSDLISSLSSSSYKASRLHLHTLSIQAICSTDEWSNPLKASARSALLAGQFACNRTDIQSETFSFYEGNDWKEEEVTKCWKEEKMTCCLALNPTCTQVVQVSGLGDNISAMGLVYHELRL
jgi:ADP-dependent glucokinase